MRNKWKLLGKFGVVLTSLFATFVIISENTSASTSVTSFDDIVISQCSSGVSSTACQNNVRPGNGIPTPLITQNPPYDSNRGVNLRMRVSLSASRYSSLIARYVVNNGSPLSPNGYTPISFDPPQCIIQANGVDYFGNGTVSLDNDYNATVTCTYGNIPSYSTITSITINRADPGGATWRTQPLYWGTPTSPYHRPHIVSASYDFSTAEDPVIAQNQQMINQNQTIINQNYETNNYLNEQNQRDQQDRDNLEQQSDDAQGSADDSQSDAEDTGTTLLTAFTSFVNALTNANPSNCNIDMDLGNLDMGVVNFCQLNPPAGFTTLSSIFLILFCVPLSIATARKVISLFRSFQS